MSAIELIQRAKFLVDASGNKTGVMLLLDIHDWETLVQGFQMLPIADVMSETIQDPGKNPLLTEFAGAASIGNLASNIDDELYGPVSAY